MIPAFTADGLLPLGIHWATWMEVAKRCGGNICRDRLLKGLERGLSALKRAGCNSIYLDGSFVTDKDCPNDYDVCWEIVGVQAKLLDPIFLDFSNQRALQKAKFLGEFFPASAIASAAPPYKTYLEFFQTDKATGNPKGIVGINL